MSSARSVPRPMHCHMNNSASTKEMAEMVGGKHWKVWTTSSGTHAAFCQKRSDSSGLRMANLLMTENYEKILRCELLQEVQYHCQYTWERFELAI